MNRKSLSLVLALTTLLLQPVRAASPDKADKPAVDPRSPELALKAEMPASAVRELMGKPEEIKPIKAPEGKAEVWVYTRSVSNRMERVGFPSAEVVTIVIGSDGQPHNQTTPGPIQYHEVYYVTEKTLELLMFNDRFVTAKISQAESQEFK